MACKGLFRWPVKALLGLTVAAFVAYCIAQPVNSVVLSPFFKKFVGNLYFPYITEALNKGGDEETLAIIPHDRLYTAAVYCIWGLTLLAALLTLLLRNIPLWRPRSKKDAEDNATPLISTAEEPSFTHSLVKRILHYELPPRHFWTWWCGGLAVYDAVVVLLWAVVNVVYVQQRVVLILPLFKKFIAQGLFPDWSIAEALIALISGALGWAATLDILLLFYPVPRSVFLHWLMGANFPTLIKYHRWLGYGTMWILTVHGCGFYGIWLWDHDWLRGLVWDRNGTNMLAGTLSWLSGCALWFTSLEYVRRNYFELFYKTHILGFLGFMLFGFMHHVSLWAYTTPGLLLYLLDVTFRMAQQVQPVKVSRVQACRSATLATLEFNTDPHTTIKPVQDLFLGVDGLSPTQWHPYSTVGGPRPHTLVAHIKSYGRWTSGLIRRLLRDGSVVMRIDGPYGEEEERPEWTRFRTVVIIAGGIGVTPVFGILNDLQKRRVAIERRDAAAGPVPDEVIFIFTAAQKNELALLQRPLIANAMSDGWLELDAYYTGANRGKDPSDFAALESVSREEKPGSARPQPHEAAPLLVSDSAVDLTRQHGSRGAFKAVSGEATANDRITRQVLPPYFFGDAHWALAHVLCFGGAVAGGVLSFAYAARARVTQPDGAPDWLIGLYLILFSSLGGMLLPALIIIPAHIIRARSIKRAAQANASNGLTNGAALAEMEEGGSLLAANGGAVELPELEATPGRPNIVALLQQICAEHADEREIGVIAAGPERMVDTAVLACHAHNDTVGLTGRPYLHVSKHTFSL